MPPVGDLAPACWICPAALLLLVAAAADDPLGEGVECLLVSHAIPVTCLWSHYPVASWEAIQNPYQPSRRI